MRRLQLGNGRAIAGLMLAMALVATCFLAPGPSMAVSLTPTQEAELAQRYAPTIHFHGGEEVFPVEVSYFIQNSDLMESVGEASTLVNANPSTVNLASYADGARYYYLDNRLGTIDDRGIINSYKANENVLGYTVYSHVTTDGIRVAVQYWFFYVFNFGTYNDHEGDWEMIEVILDSDLEPVSVAYSQHDAGQRANWSQVEKVDASPVTYVAKGSHANYFRSFQGKMGVAQDEVDGNGKVLRPVDYDLEVLGETGTGNHIADQGWIDFSGRWGNWGNLSSDFLGQRGPLGPVYRMDGAMWSGLSWADSRAALDDNLLTLEMLLSYTWLILLALLLVPLVFMVRRVLKKRRKGDLRKPFTSLLDFKGGRSHSIGNILVIAGLVLGLVGAFLPYYEVSANVQTGEFATNGYQRVLFVDGIDGISINTLVQGGMQQVGALPFPIWALIVVVLGGFIISTIAQEPRRTGVKSLIRGIGLLLPLVVIVIVVGALTGMLGSFNVPVGGESFEEMLSTISSDPFGGEKELVTLDYGTVALRWGIGIGIYVLVIAGILLIAGGALLMTARKGEVLPAMTAPQMSQT